MGTDVAANINYFSCSTDGGPAWILSSALPGEVRSNFVQAPVEVTIRDLRGKENIVNLDTNAIEVAKYNGSVQELFDDGSEAQQTYYKDISDMLKERLGASRVLIYHFSFRFRGVPTADENRDENHRNPVYYPHIDRDGPSVYKVVEKQLGQEEAEKVKKNRVQMINIWRPVGPYPITKSPLTLCDYCSIDVNKDVHPMETRQIGDPVTAYTLSPSADNAHIWYYLSRMRSDEMFLFKQFDSKPDVAQLGFHTAFQNDSESTPHDKELSLEIRCLIFYDD